MDWFLRLQASTPDPDDLEAFAQWRRDPRRADAFDRLTGLWGDPAFAAALQRRARAVAPRRPLRARLAGLAAAAVLLLALGATYLPGVITRLEADYVTATAERREIELPDGSRMLLDAASAVALDFGGGQRQVRILTGEAFFDVAHDTARPFRVEGHFGAVRVTGTAFAVRSGPETDEVVLTRGAVEVSRLSSPQDPARLVPGEMVEVGPGGLSAVRKVDPARALAWMDGRLSFSRRPLGAVVEDLRRYHDGTIVIFGDALAAQEVSGSYRLDDPVLVLRSLAEATGARMDRLPGGIIILR